MNCQKCDSDRIMDIHGKVSDCCIAVYKGYESDGYPPYEIGVDCENDSDSLSFSYCLECGQIQGKWPLSDPTLDEDNGWFKEQEIEE